MCGIVGIIHKNGNCNNNVLTHKMAESISHRGPDDEGFYYDSHAEFGFKRLSIIDLKTGHQPIFNEDQSKIIIFNGEIYNYLELRPNLEKAGHVFTTHTDTEVILHLYEEKGAACLNDLNGMFAFAIWDRVAQTLFLARDRLGVKPLYFYEDDDVFLFASEFKAIHAVISHIEVSRQALHDFLTLRYTPAPGSMIKGIKKVLPGYYLTVNGGRCISKQYWNLHFDRKFTQNRMSLQKEFWNLFVDSVSLRLRSDVPLGVFLSGGVDSSAVIVAMSELGIRDIKTFSIGFDDGPEFQEFKYAERIAKQFNTDHHVMKIGFKDFFSVLPKVLWHLDEPLADSAAIPLYMIGKLAKQYVTVILSGEGSDEVFAGYKKSYYPFYKQQLLKKFARKFPKIFWGDTALAISHSINHDLYRLIRFVQRPVIEDDIFPMSLTMSEEEKLALYSEKMKGEFGPNDTLLIFKSLQQTLKVGDYLDRKLYIDIKSWLPDDLLAKADKVTMAHGLELRVPFLDYRLVEFGASLPNRCRIQFGISKYLLKKSLEGRIPRDILYRKKMGFPVPISNWFQKGNAGHKIAIDMLLSQRTLQREIFDKNCYIQLVQAANNPVYIWYLLVLEIWFRIFIDMEQPENIKLL